MSLPNHVLIIGGGLAGPTLALALAKHSIRTTIFERSPTPQTIGSILMLSPNALLVLDKLVGAESAIRKAGYSFTHIDFHFHTQGSKLERVGGLTIGTAMGEKGEKGEKGENAEKGEKGGEGYQGLGMERAVLHDTLLGLCKGVPEITFQYGKCLERVDEEEDEVTAVFEDGTTFSGDILIGADGIGSRVRQHILGDRNISPQYGGLLHLGTVTPRSSLSLPTPDFQMPAFLVSQIGMFFIFPCNPSGSTVGWSTSRAIPERDRREWRSYGSSGQAAKDARTIYADCDSPLIQSMLAGLDDSNTKLWAPYELPDLPTWHSRRCCLIGDAAHAIPPSVGQGAAQAFEDVGFLARLLTSPQAVDKGYPALFGHYERIRKKRFDFIRGISNRSAASRWPTTNTLAWWAKRWAIGLLFRLAGDAERHRAISAVSSYNVMKEDIVVQ